MKKLVMACGAVLLAASWSGSAGEYPLKFETIAAKDVMAFPGGAGAYGTVMTAKTARIKKEPKTVSSHPLYGECRHGLSGPIFLFRLDESKGTGLGYDRLIVDMNQNGNLTDDAVVQRVVLPAERRFLATDKMDECLFGPIEAPVDKSIAGRRPIYFAHMYLFNREAISSSSPQRNALVAQLQFKAGWYLGTTVEVEGKQVKVGVFDGNSNMRLGDPWQPQTFRSGGGGSWGFQAADSFLVDANGSGKFEADAFPSEYSPFGPILYLGATPYQVSLSDDYTTLKVAPPKEEMAEVALQPNGAQVHKVSLGWERPNGKWQLIQPGVADGKIMVPPGNYRLYACTLLGSGATARDHIKLSAYDRELKQPVNFAADKANKLICGGPLDIKVAANKRKTAATSSRDSGVVLVISTSVVGAEGELYSTFLKGEHFSERPPRPAFSVQDAASRKVASGNLEYG